MSVAAASNALTTKADVKYVWGRAQTDTTHDDRIQTLINLISGRIAEYCDRVFIETAYTSELYDGNGGDTLILKQRPASEITAISIEGTAATAATITAINTAGAEFKVDYAAGIITRSISFPKGQRNISITYKAGYAAASIPVGLQSICVEWVILLLEGRMKDAVMKDADMPKAAVGQIPDRFVPALSPYKRAAIA